MMLTTIRIRVLHGIEELILDQPGVTSIPALGDSVSCFGTRAIVTGSTIVHTPEGHRSILLHAEMQSRILNAWSRLYSA
ncbi:hypothetical protein [Granulicella tundricola]|uniref:Uncharacterized protein n=1 Tax=Granulicella tundricola (strain ATCC BAA-1859 / DSM 23138 / MP5ACTX9) TaxID=1198114 RepID=E8X471_GRATM|nr:hypothetical protein [Granulicella tundricola]ADW67131.1 hypothetical protein AciX9_0040 [Granulicella tundricola MP5ACTX9]